MTRTAILAALLLTACGSAQTDPGTSAPESDSGTEASGEAATAPDATWLDGSVTEGGGGTSPEAAPPRPEPMPEASSPTRDADATVDAGKPIADATAERPAVTVCDGQAPSPPLDCTAQNPTCDNVRASNERLRAQFPQACACGAMKCAGVTSGTIVETLPVTCRNDAWTLAGMQSGSSWSPWFSCSRGCAAGKICDP